jgi:hypothetical protein
MLLIFYYKMIRYPWYLVENTVWSGSHFYHKLFNKYNINLVPLCAIVIGLKETELDLSDSGQETMLGSCECGNWHSGSIQRGKILDYGPVSSKEEIFSKDLVS